MAIAFAAVSFATYFPRSSSAETPARLPGFALSGIAATGSRTATGFLQPPAQIVTRSSVALTGSVGGSTDVRSAGSVSQLSSFTSGVTAAVAASGEVGAGVKPLADIVDPNQPFILYTTQPGDTVGLVAQKHGVAIETILNNNLEISDRNLLVLGQQLVVPRKDGIMHKVAHGETVDSIVGQYDNITTDQVVSYRPNGLTGDTTLESGQHLLLIGATIKPPPPPPPVVVSPGGGGGGGGGTAPPSSGGRFSLPLSSWLGVSDAFGTSRGGSSYHTGIDLDLYNHTHSPIYAACDGTVIRTEYLTYSYGYHVVIDCGDGWTTLYAHMSEIQVAPGQYVGQGTQLGYSGVTGYTTGEHLHFEIRLNGQYMDPAAYLPF